MKGIAPFLALACFIFLTITVNAQSFKTEVDEFTGEKLLYDQEWRILYKGPSCVSNEECLSILQLKPAYVPDSNNNLVMLNFLSVNEDLKYKNRTAAILKLNKDKLIDIEAIINGHNKKTLKMGNYKYERSNDGSAYLEQFTILIELKELTNMSPENDFKMRINNNVIELEYDQIKYLKSFASYAINNR